MNQVNLQHKRERRAAMRRQRALAMDRSGGLRSYDFIREKLDAATRAELDLCAKESRHRDEARHKEYLRTTGFRGTVNRVLDKARNLLRRRQP